jgi:hypothetical protein
VPQDQLDALDGRSAELDAREADITAREAALAEQEAAVKAGTLPGDGVFLVGSDIQPGEYRTSPEGGLCYWARLSGTSGDFDEIIANGNPTGPTVVTIEDSDYAFETTDCTEWILVLLQQRWARIAVGERTLICVSRRPPAYRGKLMGGWKERP